MPNAAEVAKLKAALTDPIKGQFQDDFKFHPDCDPEQEIAGKACVDFGNLEGSNQFRGDGRRVSGRRGEKEIRESIEISVCNEFKLNIDCKRNVLFVRQCGSDEWTKWCLVRMLRCCGVSRTYLATRTVVHAQGPLNGGGGPLI